MINNDNGTVRIRIREIPIKKKAIFLDMPLRVIAAQILIAITKISIIDMIILIPTIYPSRFRFYILLYLLSHAFIPALLAAYEIIAKAKVIFFKKIYQSK